METPREDRLAADLQALRPTPRPEFAAELDQRAAAGFPRRTHWRWTPFERLRAIRPHKLLIPAGGFAVLAIAIATAVTMSSENNDSANLAVLQPGEEIQKSNQATPSTDQGRSGSASAEYSNVVPMASSAAGSSAAGVEYEESTRAAHGPATLAAEPNPDRRSVERSAELVLAAAPGDVGDDSAKVFEAVHAHDGIVMSSSTREGKPGEAAARFELLIPSAQLGGALAALSAIDEVRTRHEATDDITAPTVATGELLHDSQARIDSLLAQLEGAESESEREAVEAELAQERRHRAVLRGQLQHLERRADYSRVLVRIETGGAEAPSEGGTWGVGDALDDAGKILAVAAAVTVVALAILGPIALIALLAWLTQRAWVRRERRRVLS
ncbi:MAG TPA: DUF4349 domain-containing protein [Solirubrobacterales bacterium]|nr:DUF4349 domain-containing protein [Solirubrobacterales bacterium]